MHILYTIWKDACRQARQGYHPVELLINKMIEQQLQYIHNNPPEEKIVLKTECYKYSFTVDFTDSLGELKFENLR